MRKRRPSGGRLFRLFDILLPCLMLALAGFWVADVLSYDIVVEACLDGESLGYVSSKNDLDSAKLALEREISDDIGSYSSINCDITYRVAYAKNPVFLTSDDCREIVRAAAEADYRVADMLWVDGVMTAASDDGDIQALINDIEDELLESAGDGYDRVELSDSIEIESQYCPVDLIMPIDEINSLLNPLADGSVRVSAFASLAPGDDDPDVDYGLSRSVPDDGQPLGYYLVSTETVDETMLYETEYIDDPESLVGRDVLLQEGKDGFRTVTYEIYSDMNGVETSRTELSETVHEAVVNEVVKRGTKPIPPAEPTGTYIWPCAVTKGLSSGYGSRDLYGSYDFHLGIDIPGTKGDEIYASDGGEVVWAGFTPSYGNSVRIQHDNGMMTLYAHMSKLHVKVGDKVYQGQLIGEMGRTGAAYGVHLHFEVRIEDKTTNPMKYLPELPAEDAEAFEQLEAAQKWEARVYNK